jgi:hypothetical protein
MQFNILSFKPSENTITVNPYSEKVKDTRLEIVFRDECPALWEQNADTLSEHKHLFCSFTNEAIECKDNKYTLNPQYAQITGCPELLMMVFQQHTTRLFRNFPTYSPNCFHG